MIRAEYCWDRPNGPTILGPYATYTAMRRSRRRVAVLCSRDARVAMRLSPLYATPCDVHILIRQSHRHEEG